MKTNRNYSNKDILYRILKKTKYEFKNEHFKNCLFKDLELDVKECTFENCTFENCKIDAMRCTIHYCNFYSDSIIRILYMSSLICSVESHSPILEEVTFSYIQGNYHIEIIDTRIYFCYVYNCTLINCKIHNSNICSVLKDCTVTLDHHISQGGIESIANNVPLACPSHGSFIGWKVVKEFLVKLEIPEDAERSSAFGNKCRCSKARVLEISNITTGESISSVTNYSFNQALEYKVGEMVYPDYFDKNRFKECSNGIHFFIDKQSAIDYLKS